MYASKENLESLEVQLMSLSSALSEMRPFFFQSPDIFEAIGNDIDVVSAVLSRLIRHKPSTVADELALIRSVVLRFELPELDDETDEPSFALRSASEKLRSLNILVQSVADAIRGAGFECRVRELSDGNLLVAREFIRQSWLSSLESRLEVFDVHLSDIVAEFEKDGFLASSFEGRILEYLTSSAETAKATIHFELVDARIIDLSCLDIASEILSETAEDFDATVQAWDDPSCNRIKSVASLLGTAAGRLKAGATTIVRGHTRMQRSADQQVDAADRRRPIAEFANLISKDELEQIASAIAGGQDFDSDRADAVTSIDLKFRGIRDLGALRQFNNLRDANLAMNPLCDISALSELRRLQILDLSVTNCDDIGPLSNLELLEELSLSGTWLKGIEAVRGLERLRTLDLSRTRVKNLRPLEGLTRIESLNLRATPVASLEPLANLATLKALNLCDTGVSDIKSLGQLRGLETLDLRNTGISDISVLGRLNDLVELNLMNTQVRDISPIIELPNLKKLKISGAPVANVVQLKKARSNVRIDVRI